MELFLHQRDVVECQSRRLWVNVLVVVVVDDGRVADVDVVDTVQSLDA